MNKILKMLVQESIHHNMLTRIKAPTGDRYIIFDKSGREILSVDNGWATNHYSIYVNKQNLLSVKWDETNSRPLDKNQKDMLDIINACKEKIDFQETVQTMNSRELEMANFLQKSLCNVKQ